MNHSRTTSLLIPLVLVITSVPLQSQEKTVEELLQYINTTINDHWGRGTISSELSIRDDTVFVWERNREDEEPSYHEFNVNDIWRVNSQEFDVPGLSQVNWEIGFDCEPNVTCINIRDTASLNDTRTLPCQTSFSQRTCSTSGTLFLLESLRPRESKGLTNAMEELLDLLRTN